jgi:DNA modification methylase
MQTLPDACVDLSVYSPPFGAKDGAMYKYSSSDRDLSNNDSYEAFLEHYAFVVREVARLTKPGRFSAVHCMEVPTGNTGDDDLIDFPGDIIRIHRAAGFRYRGRHVVWKEPLSVRLRTMQKNLAHATLVEDSGDCGIASADFVLLFRREGQREVPIAHPHGLMDYAGATSVPSAIVGYRGWTGKQTGNRYSQWIWRQYASSVWADVRIDRVLPYKMVRDPEDEKHVHPLQLDDIERVVTLRSNPGETVLTPFMGVGSEAYIPLLMGRKAIGIELKPTYYRQAVKNCEAAAEGRRVHIEEETRSLELWDMDSQDDAMEMAA